MHDMKRDDQEEFNEITFSEAMDLVMGLWMRHATCEENSTGAGYRPRSKGRSQSRNGSGLAYACNRIIRSVIISEYSTLGNGRLYST